MESINTSEPGNSNPDVQRKSRKTSRQDKGIFMRGAPRDDNREKKRGIEQESDKNKKDHSKRNDIDQDRNS